MKAFEKYTKAMVLQAVCNNWLRKREGSVEAAKRIQRIQRIAVTAGAGTRRTKRRTTSNSSSLCRPMRRIDCYWRCCTFVGMYIYKYNIYLVFVYKYVCMQIHYSIQVTFMRISHAASAAKAHLKFGCWHFWFYFKSRNYFRKLDFGFAGSLLLLLLFLRSYFCYSYHLLFISPLLFELLFDWVVAICRWLLPDIIKYLKS